MKVIGLQAGHQNIQNNIDLQLRGGTGAAPANFTSEIQWTPKVRDELGRILLTKKNADGTQAFQIQLDDANSNSSVNTIGKDFDFYLAIHFEANTHGKGGGFMTAPDPSVDSSNTESKRIVQTIKGEYFKETGIVETEGWITPAMTFYYMWNVLTAKTPCGIIECGVGGDAHDDVILGDITRVATAIARGICDAFSVPFDYIAPNTPPPVVTPPVVVEPPVTPVPPVIPPVVVPPVVEPPVTPPTPPIPPVVTPPVQSDPLTKIHDVVYAKWTYIGKNGWKNRLHQIKAIFES
jgi:hypothetical protein